ncbi:hypothetical protein LTR95_001695 [Oleoguttula sp. CCFEE 5521]
MPSIRNTVVATVAALGATANAFCLTDAEAQQVATNWGNLIATYSDSLADAALEKNFTDYSESVSSLINGCPQGSAAEAITLPLLEPTFSTLAAFKMGQGQQAPINFEQLQIWHGCTSVNIRWKTTNTAPIPNPKPVVGLIAMEVNEAPSGSQYPYLINTIYSEFDAAAWLQNLVEAGICKAPTGLTATAACSSSAPGATPAPYPTGNGTVVAPTSTASPSSPPAYTGPAYTGAASSLTSSFAAISAVLLGALVLLQ